MADGSQDGFRDLLRRLVRVPKDKIDEQERIYQGLKRDSRPAKAGEIVPRRVTPDEP
jgi:hypothetical protein